MSRLGVGWVQGAQSKGVIANVKHYAANNQEGAVAGGERRRPGPAARAAAGRRATG